LFLYIKLTQCFLPNLSKNLPDFPRSWHKGYILKSKIRSVTVIENRQDRLFLLTAIVIVFTLLIGIAAPARSNFQPAGEALLFSDNFDDNQLNPAWIVYGGTWVETGKILSQNSTTTSSPKKVILSGSELNFTANQTITAKVRVDSWIEGNNNSRAGVSLFTGTGNGQGYSLIFVRDHSTVRFLDETSSWGPLYTFTWTSGTWYWFKLKNENGTLSGKIWQDGMSEPATWVYTWARSGRSGYPALYGGSNNVSSASFNDTVVTNDSTAPASTSTLLPVTATPTLLVNTPTISPLSTSTSVPTSPSATAQSPTPLPSPSGEITLAFIDGYGGNVFTAKDTLMSASWPTRNGGTHPDFQLSSTEPQHALMEFDLSTLPSNAVILRATLFLYNSYGPGDGGGSPISTVYSLSAANDGWIEGTKNIGLPSAGEPFWNAKASNASGGVQIPWAGSAGASTPGIDYEVEAMGSFSWTPRVDVLGKEYAIDLSAGRVQSWVGSNHRNYGIIIITTNGSGHVASSEHMTTAFRPKLVLQYTIPVNP
jgi:hypothetical protein